MFIRPRPRNIVPCLFILVSVFGVHAANVHDLDGDYWRVLQGGMSFCMEKVHFVVNDSNLVKIDFDNYPLTCNLPLEFSTSVLSASDQWSHEFATIVHSRKLLICSGHKLNVQMFIPLRNLTKFGTTLTAGTKYVLFEQVGSEHSIQNECLYSSPKTVPAMQKSAKELEKLSSKTVPSPTNWVKFGAIFAGVSCFCAVANLTFALYQHQRDSNEQSTTSASDAV